MKLIYCLIIFFCPLLGTGQTVKPLTIGDTVPDITLTNVYNYSSSTIRLSQLKGKLVILDFWATWCGSCLNSMPEMEELKKKFGDEVQVLLINSFNDDDKEKVGHTFENLHKRTGKNITLPYVLQDSLLSNFFPHRFVPHYVWLSNSRQVLAITDRDAVTASNIHAFLISKPPSLIIKDDKLAYNPELPLLIEGNGGDDSTFLYRSIVTKYKENLGETGGMAVNADGKVTKFYLIDIPVMNIIKEAYPRMRNFNPFQIELKVSDPDKYKYYKDRKKQKENSFCYELICPPVSSELLRKYIRDDLQKYFNITVEFTKRMKDGYDLIATGKGVIAAGDSSYSQSFNEQPVNAVITLLEGILEKPVSDKTAITDKINFNYPKELAGYSLDRINKVLKKNGFYLVPSKQEVSIAVVTENEK